MLQRSYSDLCGGVRYLRSSVVPIVSITNINVITTNFQNIENRNALIETLIEVLQDWWYHNLSALGRFCTTSPSYSLNLNTIAETGDTDYAIHLSVNIPAFRAEPAASSEGIQRMWTKKGPIWNRIQTFGGWVAPSVKGFSVYELGGIDCMGAVSGYGVWVVGWSEIQVASGW
jgi:hypothetical protein